MTDKRRKRPMMTVTSSQHDRPRADFHVVNIGDGGISNVPRRRSASAGRSESWMSKVTNAMSHRLFSGRRLSGSRSTQVMPMLNGKEQISQSRDNPGTGDRSLESSEFKRAQGHSLRQVSSETTLQRPTPIADKRALLQESDQCPSVVCDVEEDPPLEVDAKPSSMSTIRVGSPRQVSLSKSAKEKVYPRAPSSNSGDDSYASVTTLGPAFPCISLASHRDDVEVQSATPILKDFFSRTATTTHKERAYQREVRREQHYKARKERHESLRERCRVEEEMQADEIHRNKVELLRRRNQERRLQIRQEASKLKKYVLATETTTQELFDSEREKWEHNFQDEMDILARAYRKVYAKDERPMTVAGLVVPEALTTIQRDATNYTRRLKTAAPAGWSSTMEPMGSRRSRFDILHIEDSKEVHEVFAEDEANCLESEETLTVETLLAERAQMARRIAQLEQQVEASKLSIGVEAADTDGIKEGFFI